MYVKQYLADIYDKLKNYDCLADFLKCQTFFKNKNTPFMLPSVI